MQFSREMRFFVGMKAEIKNFLLLGMLRAKKLDRSNVSTVDLDLDQYLVFQAHIMG